MVNKEEKYLKRYFLKKINNLREKNNNWILYSKKVAKIIKDKLGDDENSIASFSSIMNISEEKASAMLSGKYNFKLKELFDIEQKLNLNFLMI